MQLVNRRMDELDNLLGAADHAGSGAGQGAGAVTMSTPPGSKVVLNTARFADHERCHSHARWTVGRTSGKCGLAALAHSVGWQTAVGSFLRL